MKQWTLLLYVILFVVIYRFAFDYLTNRQIVFTFMAFVATVILYFSLRLCFVDKNK